MTATDDLRRLLDERGVEWKDYDGEPTWIGDDGEMYYARQEFTFAGLTDRVTVYHLTPEQAIDATLGRGTCRFEQIPEALYDDIECSECGVALWGFQMDIAGEGCPTRPRYCPNCGRRCVG